MERGRLLNANSRHDKKKKEISPTEYEALLGFNQKIPYPKSVFFIVINEFCERFSFYGMKAILTLYLRNVLKYSESTATTLYHTFVMFSYLTCVPGAIIADSWLGKFRTIFILSIVYAIGNTTICLASAGTSSSTAWIPTVPLSFIGLSMIAIGTGGIKPCVSAFGGEQFHIPGQEKSLEQFFFIFYFAINMGSLISVFVTPILRRDVSCLDSETCYPLAFGLPAILMFTALFIFLIGKPFYKIKRPTGNVILEVSKCVIHAIRNRKNGPYLSNYTPNQNWLDYATDKFDYDFIQDVKKLFSIILLFVPLPIFWSLFEQQGSRWTFQASKTNGYLFNGWVIKPDQMQVVNSFMVILFIPLFDQLLYPALAKCNLLKKPLQRIAVGGFLASASFILAGLLEMKLEPTYAVLPGPFESQINFINTLPCQLNVSLSSTTENDTEVTQVFTQRVFPNSNVIYKSLAAPINYSVQIEHTYLDDSCLINNGKVIDLGQRNFTIFTESQKASSILIGLNENFEVDLKYSSDADDLVKSQDGNAKLKVLLDKSDLSNEFQVIIHSVTKQKEYEMTLNRSEKVGHVDSIKTMEIEPDIYSVRLSTISSKWPSDYTWLGDIALDTGGVYLLAIYSDQLSNVTAATADKQQRFQLIQLTEANSIHMLFLLPQYFVITTAEILFSITGYAFSYAEAPQSMKSVVQAVWLLTNAAGSFIVILVTETNLIPRQMIQFFFFSGLMFMATVAFVFLAYNYVPLQPRTSSSILKKKSSLPVAAIEPFFQLIEKDLTDEDELEYYK